MYAISVNPDSGLPPPLPVARIVSHVWASSAHTSQPSICILPVIKYSLIHTHVLNLQVQGAPKFTFISGDIGCEICWQYPIVKWLETAKLESPALGPRILEPAHGAPRPPLSTLWSSSVLSLHPHNASLVFCVKI